MFKKANLKDIKDIKKFKVFEKSKFIEFPKLGLLEMDKIVKNWKTIGRDFAYRLWLYKKY